MAGSHCSTMKTCSYCGRVNEDVQQRCFECGTELTAPTPSTEVPVSQSSQNCSFCNKDNPAGCSVCVTCGNELVPIHPESHRFQSEPDDAELPDLTLDYESENGFSYPDWEKVWQQVETSIPRTAWDAVYRRAAREWISQLCLDLGGVYRAYESARFLLMCAEGQHLSETLLQYAEAAQSAIANQIGAIQMREVFGKQVLLVFSEDDDYYSYISRFFPEGTHNLSSGVFITGGYGHIAIPFRFAFAAKAVIQHELVHNNLFHLPIPLWLNEGLAQRIERRIGNRGFVVDGDMIDRHREFWNDTRIQEFWAGTSFDQPGDGTELSYSIGEILVELLAEDYPAFLDFAGEADWRDAGQDAAVRILDKDLGAVLEGFLGPGNWRPNRKKLSDLFKTSADATTHGPDDSKPALESALPMKL